MFYILPFWGITQTFLYVMFCNRVFYFIGDTDMKKTLLITGLMAGIIMLSFNTHAANDCGSEGNCWDCGQTPEDSCTARIIGTTLYISGSGAGMKNYSADIMPQWRGANITNIVVGNGIERIGNGAFVNMSGVTSVELPASLTHIGQFAFTGMTGIEGTFTIPDKVTNIEWGAFQGMSGVNNLIIPNSVTTIEQYAFQNMTGLTDLTIPDNVTTFSSSIWYGTNLTSLTIPDGAVVSDMSDNTWALRSLTSLTISPEQMVYNESGSISGFMVQTSLCKHIFSAEHCAEAAAYFEANPDAGTYEFTEEKSFLSRLPANLTINCRGSAEDCQQAFQHANGTQTLVVVSSSSGAGTSLTEVHNSDGSTTFYNADGTIKGYKGKRIYTVKEANEVAGKQNTLKIRYK